MNHRIENKRDVTIVLLLDVEMSFTGLLLKTVSLTRGKIGTREKSKDVRLERRQW